MVEMVERRSQNRTVDAKKIMKTLNVVTNVTHHHTNVCQYYYHLKSKCYRRKLLCARKLFSNGAHHAEIREQNWCDVNLEVTES